MELSKIAADVKAIFDENDYSWKIDGSLKIPTKQDIEDTLNEVVERMQTMPDGAWMELGRIIFMKTEKMIDVYVLHGTIVKE